MRPMPFLHAAAIALVALHAGGAGATTLLDTGFGTPQGASTPRALAMGSVGVSLLQGSDALFFNPAVTATASGRVQADVSVTLTQANEDRLVPIFDSFQSFVDETIIAINRNTYADVSGGLLWRLPAARPMTFGVGVFERYDFDFDYFEEFRDPDAASSPRDRILQNRDFEVDGRLRSVSAGYGAEVVRDARLGLSLHRYFGDISMLRHVATPAAADPDSLATLRQDLEGWGWSIGAHGRAHERVDLAVSYEGEFRLEGARALESSVSSTAGTTRTESASEQKIDYPGTLRFGVSYRPRNELRTVLAVEMARRFWESVEDSNTTNVLGQPVHLRDTWELAFGLEHVFYNGMPLRMGFRYVENYADGESERSIFSLGIGYAVAGMQLDVTGLYHRQTSRQGFLFDPTFTSGGVVFPAPDSDSKVEDTVLQLVLGASRRF